VELLPPLLPCGGLTGGVFPEPAEVFGPSLPPPPPEPPGCPFLFPAGAGVQPEPPPPPPADVIVLKTDFDPLFP